MIVVTAAEMRALDRWTIEEHGTAGHVLMERAGAGAARLARARSGSRGRVVVVCGHGNNGGDGFVVARHLRRARVPVEVWLTADTARVTGDAARMLAAWTRAGGRVAALRTAADLLAFRAAASRATLIVDALLGTGLNASVTGHLAAVITAVNEAGGAVLALDVPSGLSADTGQPLGVAVQATATATFGFAKVGQWMLPGADRCGLLAVVDIGIPAGALEAVRPQGRVLTAAQVAPALPRRPRDGHKGTFGHVLVVAGSRGKTGAALLATEAAARAGAGLVTLASSAGLQGILEGHVREAMTAALPDAGDGGLALGGGAQLAGLLEGKAAVVCGPGLGATAGVLATVGWLLRHADQTLVLDADGLNVLDGVTRLARRQAATILTPHPGEMGRLAGIATQAVQADRVGTARRFALASGTVVVLKGARTIVAAPDGRYTICPAGNPGLASGGTGDVLAGAIGGLVAQGLAPFEAACAGVLAHAVAADRVAAEQGERGLLARDVCAALPGALAAITAPAAPTPRGRRGRP